MIFLFLVFSRRGWNWESFTNIKVVGEQNMLWTLALNSPPLTNKTLIFLGLCLKTNTEWKKKGKKGNTAALSLCYLADANFQIKIKDICFGRRSCHSADIGGLPEHHSHFALDHLYLHGHVETSMIVQLCIFKIIFNGVICNSFNYFSNISCFTTKSLTLT